MKSLYLWIYNFLGVGGPSGKIMEIPGGGGSNMKPPEMENPGGGWSNLKKTLRGGYGYFLEQHIVGQIHV